MDAGLDMAYFEHALQETAARHELHLVDVSGISCIEIDFAEDLEEAHRLASADQGSSCGGEISLSWDVIRSDE